MPFSTNDTIAAVATPPGRGGIGVVRLSGPGAPAIAARLITHHGPLEPRRATLTKLAGHDRGDVVDHVVATYFPGPASYTGDDVVELSAHGSPVILNAIVAAAATHGARLAEPGEFTLRAFLNGRIDLMQAEAVADLIDAATPLQARAAFDQLDGTLTRAIGEIDAALFDLIARLEASIDFPDEGYHFVAPGALAGQIDALLARTACLLADGRRGRLIREGLRVVIVGAPNVGKSSLFNALVGAPRAIVTEVPGTTRDLVTEVVDIAGLRVTLADTAGLRETDDPVEVLGVERSRQSAAGADLVLRVVDRSEPRCLMADYKGLIVANKADLPPAWDDASAVAVSATTGAGLDELRRRIADALDVDFLRERPAITNVRHIALVDQAHGALGRARAAALDGGRSMPEEFVLADLLEARAALEEITGRRTPEDVLDHIFARFCIGK
jgi:tRNA modification GTPase